MEKLRIVADNKIPFLQGVLEPYADVRYMHGFEITKEDVLPANCLITRTRTKCNSRLLDGSKVSLITTATIGYDHIDTHWCDKNRIAWFNAKGCNSGSVAQYVAASLLYLAVRFELDLSQLTIGVIGAGNVGTKVIKVAQTLGMKVLINDPPRAREEGEIGFVSLDEIKEKADIITFHVPLIKAGDYKTYHLADDDFFTSLGKKAHIINTARGEVIDSKALKVALDKRKLASAVIDVWESEPIIDKELLDLVEIGTPHIAGYSIEGKANGTAMVVNAISQHFKLGIDNWTVENLPPPKKAEIEIDCANKTLYRILWEVVKATYPIKDDDGRLRRNLSYFERLRGEYPVRREFPVFIVNLINEAPTAKEIIQNLGFKLKQSV